MDRREVLVITGATLSVPLVGCLGSAPEGDGNNTDDADKQSESEPIEEWEYDVAESAPSLTFGKVGPDDHSLAVHITSAERAEEAFTYENLADDAKRKVQTFVGETEFETAMLFYIETRAPNSCHGLRIQSLDISGDYILTGSLKSRDTLVTDVVCGAVETTPSLLVRVTTEPGLPSHAELDVTDGWGETEQLVSSSV